MLRFGSQARDFFSQRRGDRRAVYVSRKDSKAVPYVVEKRGLVFF